MSAGVLFLMIIYVNVIHCYVHYNQRYKKNVGYYI